jgi:carbon starvation protein
MTQASKRIARGLNLDAIIKYWYHFAIMFEALFILTTIDTGTRIARFLMQEALGKLHPKFDQTDWLPGAVLATAIVVAGWGGLIATGSIDTIWPMFGIANQMLAVIALAVVTTVMVNAGRGRYAWLTILPMAFVVTTTSTAAWQLVTRTFAPLIADGWSGQNYPLLAKGLLNAGFTVFIVGCVFVILLHAVTRWINHARRRRRLQPC